MSVSRPARCLVSTPIVSRPRVRAQFQCRRFHPSPPVTERRRSRFASIKASEVEKRLGAVPGTSNGQLVKPYDADQKGLLAKKYTPEQLQVVEAGEDAINPADLARQAVARRDMYRLPYLDDLSVVKPVIDHKPRGRGQRAPTRPRTSHLAEDDDHDHDFQEFMARHQDKVNSLEYRAARQKILDEQGPEAAEAYDIENGPSEVDLLALMDGRMFNGPNRGVAPSLPKISEFKGQYDTKDENDPRDPEGKYTTLQKSTGMSLDDILGIRVKILVQNSVTNQTRLGKIQSLYVLAIAGNRQGRLGLGEGKATEAEEAMNQARLAAIKNMKPIPRYEDRTIYGEVEGKVSASEVQLMARPPGYGLRCQHNIFEMARAAGIHDLSARVPRSRNKMNTIKAAYQAFMSQRLPDEIARGRGRKLVDVRKVYYGGDQPKPRRVQERTQLTS